MIIQKEIIDIAHKKGVKTKTIDKDWVLGHFLNVFYSFEESRKNFVFKGGTCLRKCYFEDYRFSEDLDFILLDKKFIVDAAFIKKVIKKADENSGIRFHLQNIKVQESNEVEQGHEVIIKSIEKGIEISDVEQFVNDKKERSNKRAWGRSLSDHLPENKLPDFDDVYEMLKGLILKILNAKI